MKERLRVKPILLGFLVAFVGGAVTAIGVVVYTTGGDLAKMQSFATEASTMTTVALSLAGVFFALLAGFVTAKLAPHDPGRHVARLALVLVILSALELISTVVQSGVGAQLVIGILSTAATYGAVLLGGYLAEDDEATDETGA
jgi:hypothetical protein